jgi:hypothetical protein
MKIAPSLLLIGAGLLGAVSEARAIAKLSPDSELFLTADSNLAYNDNILLTQNNAKSDTVFDIAPGLKATWGQNSSLSGQASFKEDFTEYFSNSELNSSLALVDLSNNYDDGVSKVSLNAWYHQVDQATRDVRNANSLIKRDLSHADISGENQASAKSSVKLGFAYDNTDYQTGGYANWQWYNVTFDYYYKMTPKLDLSAGFQYKDNRLGAHGLDSTEDFYNVGFRGELAPKLTGELHVGFVSHDFQVLGTRNDLGLASSFTYAYSEKTNVTFGASDNYGYSADGSAYRDVGINAGFYAAVNSSLAFNAMISYANFDYFQSTRKDDYVQVQLSATYTVNRYVSLIGAYAYADNSSNAAAVSFTNNILSISAKIAY